MRLIFVRLGLIGLAAALAGCVEPYGSTSHEVGLARVDPQDAAERALVGGIVGTALGTGLGTIASINPAIGASIGAQTGAVLGAAIGAATAQPLPEYAPIVVPTALVVPGFYDAWPPGFNQPAVDAQTPPPRPG